MDAVFGELRALVHSVPSAAGWDALADLCGSVARAEPARWADEIAPYLDGALERWPDALRVCSSADTRALMDGQPPSPRFAICRALNKPSAGRLVSPHDPLYHLSDQPALARIRYLRLDIDAEITSPMWARLLASPNLGDIGALELHSASIGGDGAALLRAHPMCTRLHTLILRGCPIGKKAARQLFALPIPITDTLCLEGCNVGAPGLRALAQSPTARPHTLSIHTNELSEDGASAHVLLDGGGPLLDAVEVLALPGYNARVTERLPLLELLDRCQPLRSLDLSGLSVWRPGLLDAALSHPRLASLSELVIRVGDYARGASIERLLQAPFLRTLRALRLDSWRISPEEMAQLAACEALAGLERLVISGEAPSARRVLMESPYVGAAIRAGDPYSIRFR